MKTLTLTLSGNTYFGPDIVIDNQIVKPKKNKKGKKTYIIETEKNELNVEISKWYELNTKHWLLISLIFFIVSCFGLFDIRNKKNYVCLNYKGVIKLFDGAESNLRLSFSSFKDGEKAFISEGNCEISDNESNIYIRDEELERRAKILANIKKYTWISLVAIALISFILILIL